MMVRFSTICDAPVCGKRSDEYTAWPFCRECLIDVCPEHQEPGTVTDPDVDAPPTCLCRQCAAEPRRPDIVEIGIGACGSERKLLLGMFLPDAWFVCPGEAEVGLGEPGAEAVVARLMTNFLSAPGSAMTFNLHIPIELTEPNTHVSMRFNDGPWHGVTPIVADAIRPQSAAEARGDA